jgi:DNA-binding NarL/FixJ family response regulator
MLPELSVILVTGYLEPAVIFEALGAGASGYLARPVTASACRSAIDDVVNGGAPLCREAARLLLNFFKYATAVVADLPTVSGREKDIIACLVQGCSDREIAAQLGIGTATVHTHMHRMFGKLGVSDRHSAVSKYVGIRSRIPSRSRRERTPIFGP